MEPVQWHDSFSVGVNIVDTHHKKLFSIVNELIAGIKAGNSRDTISKVLMKLVDYYEYHFKTEEEFFRMHPRFKDHQLIHKNFVKSISDFMSLFHSGNAELGNDMLHFLVDWLKAHILDVDKNYFMDLHYSSFLTSESKNSDQETPLAWNKVLIVDDAVDQRFLLRAVLEGECHEVIEAGNGLDALKICQDNADIRIVLTDINMPVMNGYELIEALRAQQSHYIYIIVITSTDDGESIIKALSCGADDYLSKPIVPDELNLRIQGGQRLIRLESQDELIFSMAKLSD